MASVITTTLVTHIPQSTFTEDIRLCPKVETIWPSTLTKYNLIYLLAKNSPMLESLHQWSPTQLRILAVILEDWLNIPLTIRSDRFLFHNISRKQPFIYRNSFSFTSPSYFQAWLLQLFTCWSPFIYRFSSTEHSETCCSLVDGPFCSHPYNSSYIREFSKLGSTLPVHSTEGAGLPAAVQRNSARWPCWTRRTAGWIVTVGFVASPATVIKNQLISYKEGRDAMPSQ